jgi:GH25 family lysozyme M1 (1,4-beta-N-acetylmuramidase)
MIGYGLDLSHFQDPAALPWAEFQGRVDFVIARASFGVVLDNRAKAHISRARGIGAKVGLYTFFRPSQSWTDQLQALRSVADGANVGTGDIVPALDIEDDPISPEAVSPAWSDRCQAFVEKLVSEYGEALVYITQRGWSMLGKPEWVLHRPLWCAHYRDALPATPGNMPATIHQHRVGPFVPNGPGGSFKPAELDQNRLLLPLPLIGYRPSDDDRARVLALVSENLRRAVQEPDDGDDDPASVA